MDIMKKVSKEARGAIKKALMDEFESHVEEVKEIIIDSYNINIASVVTDRRSRTNPGLPKYIDAFNEKLEEFEMIEEDEDTVSFIVPTLETFDFSSGPLRVIQTILEGTIGTYVEVDAEQYEKMYEKRPIGLQVFDDTAQKKDMVYILRYTADVRKRERNAFGKIELVPYPFSNIPPIDIFESAGDYVERNISSWVDDAVSYGLHRFSKEYRG